MMTNTFRSTVQWYAVRLHCKTQGTGSTGIQLGTLLSTTYIYLMQHITLVKLHLFI